MPTVTFSSLQPGLRWSSFGAMVFWHEAFSFWRRGGCLNPEEQVTWGTGRAEQPKVLELLRSKPSFRDL